MRLLDGVRVLDAAHGVAAPFAAQVLRWLGADVTRCARSGDWLDELEGGYASHGRCLVDYVHEGKEQVAPNADHPMQLLALLGQFDVLVVDWTTRVWAELGLSPDRITAAHPGLVVLSVTGFGLSGPRSEQPSSELTIYHAGGEGYLLPGGDVYRAFPDRPPVRGGRFLADFDTGLAAAFGAVAAVLRRDVSGTGDLVEVCGYEVEVGNNRTTLGRAFYEGVDFDRGYAGYDYAGVLRCVDGWVCLRPSEERHWQQFCAVIERPDLAVDPRFVTRSARFENNDALNVALGEWAATRTQDEARAALLAAQCPGGPYLEPDRVLVDPAIGSRHLIDDVSSGGRAPQGLLHAHSDGGDAAEPLRERMGAGGTGPLAGLRVLDLTWVAAGPYATELLAFLGAEVFKIESRTVPDLFRRGLADPLADLDGNIRFADLNQSKKSVSLNLKTEAGRSLLLELAEHSDVLVENYRPGVRDRLGLGDDVLHARNPGLVVLSLSGFGASATDRDRPGYASIFSAESGISAMTGYPDAPPADIRDSNDLRTGTGGALAAVAGLRAVLAGRQRVTIDGSARDTLIALQGDAVLQASRGGRPTRSANAVDACAPYGCYRTKDGWVAVAVRTGAEWRGLVAALDADRLRDPVLETAGERVARREDVDRVVEGWCENRLSDEVVDTLVGHGVPAARSAAASTISGDPHLVSRGFLNRVDHPVLGAIELIGCPVRFSGAGTATGVRPPLLGEHTSEVLSAILGLDDDRLAQLAADEVTR